MNDTGINIQSILTDQTSNKLAETNNNFSLSRFPIEVKEDEIWQYLSFKQRAEVHQTFWPKGLWKDVYFTKPDIFRYSQPLKQVGESTSLKPFYPSKSLQSLTEDRMLNELTKTKFSSIAISFKSKTREQMIAFRTFIDLLPHMEVQDLVISSGNEDCFRSPVLHLPSDEDLVLIPGLLFLPEEDVWDVVDAIRMSREAIANDIGYKEDRWEPEVMVRKAVLKTLEAQRLAQITSLANCSHLRSLILDVDFNILPTISQKPISQCKLDILSIQSGYSYHSSLRPPDVNELCNMVREAQVLDIISDWSVTGSELARDLMVTASRTLKYLTITLGTREHVIEGDVNVITFPMLEHLHLADWKYDPVLFKLDCPNLKTLHLEHLVNIQWLLEISSVQMLFIDKTNFAWSLLEKAGAIKVHTLYLYEIIGSSHFFRLFSKNSGLPHLDKIVILRSKQMYDKLNLCEFIKFFRGRVQDIRKIKTLIWETERSESSSPSSSDECFIRTHLATNFKWINGRTQSKDQSLEYSSEIMGDFVKHKSVADKLEFFQQFLQRSSKD